MWCLSCDRFSDCPLYLLESTIPLMAKQAILAREINCMTNIAGVFRFHRSMAFHMSVEIGISSELLLANMTRVLCQRMLIIPYEPRNLDPRTRFVPSMTAVLLNAGGWWSVINHEPYSAT